MKPPQLINPCINICKIDPFTNVCIGCKRTQKEISEWFWMDENQKKIIMKKLKNR